MNNFRTSLPQPAFSFDIRHQEAILAMGSCFATNIGQRLKDLKFDVQLNPFGILYNPISIAESIAYIIDQKTFETSDLFQHQGLWHSFAHHGSFSQPEPASALHHIHEHITKAHTMLPRLKTLLLTFGTAYVFQLRDQQKVVANCHKRPSSDFTRDLLTVEQIVSSLQNSLERLKKHCPDLRIVLTVSPIRHIRDGLVMNQRSKASLVLAAHQLCEQLEDVHYFPSYELMVDDLRDYRFYAADMIHPSPVATDHIWQYFKQTFFESSTQELIRQIDKIQSAYRHRPLHPTTANHQRFVRQTLQQIDNLEQEHPFLNLEEERAAMKRQLTD